MEFRTNRYPAQNGALLAPEACDSVNESCLLSCDKEAMIHFSTRAGRP